MPKRYLTMPRLIRSIISGCTILPIVIIILQILVLHRARLDIEQRDKNLRDMNLKFTLRFQSSENTNSSKIMSVITDLASTRNITSHNTILKRFLAVGIPTVRRKQSDYLIKTIDSLLNSTTGELIKELYIVVFLADFNETWRQQSSGILNMKYAELVQNHTIQIITAPKDFYPTLDNLTRNFNDSESRTKWRSKQNVDYAYLWLYCNHLSTYYLQIEDDVITSLDSITKIKKFIALQRQRWVCLEFSNQGFIGKLFHSGDLETIAKYALLFYDQQPVDYLLRYFLTLNVQSRPIVLKPRLFHHIGYYSSLYGKISAVDSKFLDTKKSIKGDNPKAELFSTLKSSPPFKIEAAYSTKDGLFFWSQSVPAINDTIHVMFYEPQSVKKVVVITGSREHPKDILQHAQLDACVGCQASSDNHVKCFDEYYLGSFINGTVIFENLRNTFRDQKILCLRITVTDNHESCLLIKEVAVLTD